MENEIKTYLYDILKAIEEIESFFECNKKTFADYQKNTMRKRAVERNLTVIGEAANRIEKRENGVKLEHNRKIIGLRNRIMHGYDSVDDAQIWNIIINDLPKLKIEVNNLINDF